MSDDNWLDDHLDLYAIDSLPDDERRRFEDELAALGRRRRREAADRIAAVQETMSDYASRFAVAAPTELRSRVLADFSAHTGNGGQTGNGGHTGAGVVTPIDRAHRYRRRIAGLVAAAAIIIVAVGAGVVIGRSTAPAPQSTSVASNEVAAVLSAPDAAVAHSSLAGRRGTLLVVSSRSRDQAVAVLGEGSNPLPSDRSLQLWLVGTSPAPISAGVVDSYTAPPLLINGIGNSSRLAATLEPRGGSAAPTTPLLTAVPL